MLQTSSRHVLKTSKCLLGSSRVNLPKIKGGAYVINLDEYSDIGTHWVALYVHNNDVTYFDNFRVEHISKVLKLLLIVFYL